MNYVDKQYHELCERILKNGTKKDDRTGTGTLSVFGYQMRFNLQEGFPLLTTKRLPFRVIAHELLWFLSGNTGLKYLLDKDVNIWNADAYRNYVEQFKLERRKPDLTKEQFLDIVKNHQDYNLGPIYGHQWRSWGEVWESIDQIKNVIKSIKENPNSRRHLVSAWNASDLENMALPPCHYAFQFYVNDGKLSCKFEMRSTDVFLGLPFNIASYALLTHMVARECDLEVGELIYSGGDVHIYLNHIEQVKEQLTREPKQLPTLVLNPNVSKVDDFTIEDMTVEGYEPHPTIKGAVSVG